MKKGIYILPNAITLSSLFFGFYAIISSYRGSYIHAAWAILIAMVLDGLDGWIARVTNSTTRFGIELDSLSDLVAFGIAPAVLVYSWALQNFNRVGWGVCFLYVLCGALRLARYNVQMGSDERKAFVGMPIPGAATVVASLVLFYNEIGRGIPGKDHLVLILIFLLSLVMVSTLRYHGLKEVNPKKRKPFWLLIMFVVILVLLFIHPEIMVFIFSISYMMWGIIETGVLFYRKRKGLSMQGHNP